jgi:hypothetical protein
MTRAQRARARLFALLMRSPPAPDRRFRCGVCGVELPGRAVTLDEMGRGTCGDCTGRLPEGEGFLPPHQGER